MDVPRTQRLIRWGILIALVVGVGFLFAALEGILQPLLVGFLIAYLLDPVIDKFETWHLPRPAGIALLMLLLATALVLIVLVALPLMVDQLQHFADRLPGYVQATRESIEPEVRRLLERYPDQAEEVRQRALEAVRSNYPKLLAPVYSFLSYLTSSLANLIVGILNLIVIPVLAVYLLKDIDVFTARVGDYIPVRWRDGVLPWIGEVDQVLRLFVRGQVSVSLVLAFLYAVGLTLLDTPLGIGVGLVSGLANVVPYLGVAIGLLPALLLSFLEHGSWVRLAGVVGVFAAAQSLEGMVITPRLVGSQVGLHPVVVIVAVMLGGTYFGFLGLLLAVPVAAVLNVFARRASAAYLRSDFYLRRASVSSPPRRKVRYLRRSVPRRRRQGR